MEFSTFLLVLTMTCLLGFTLWFVLHRTLSDDVQGMIKSLDSKNASAHKAVLEVNNIIAKDMEYMSKEITKQGDALEQVERDVHRSKKNLEKVKAISEQIDNQIERLNFLVGTVDQLSMSQLKQDLDEMKGKQAVLKTILASKPTQTQLEELKKEFAAQKIRLEEIGKLVNNELATLATNRDAVQQQLELTSSGVSDLQKMVDDSKTKADAMSKVFDEYLLQDANDKYGQCSSDIDKYFEGINSQGEFLKSLGQNMRIDHDKKRIYVKNDSICLNDTCITKEHLTNYIDGCPGNPAPPPATQ